MTEIEIGQPLKRQTFFIPDRYVVVCTDLSGKRLHRQVSVGIVVTSGSLCGIMVSHSDLKFKRCAFVSSSRCNISHFHHSQPTMTPYLAYSDIKQLAQRYHICHLIKRGVRYIFETKVRLGWKLRF